MDKAGVPMKRSRNSGADPDRDPEAQETLPTTKRTKALPAREVCEYGKNCYRRSMSHFLEFKHTALETLFLEATRNGIPLCSVECAGFPDANVARGQLEILLDSGIQAVIESESGSTPEKDLAGTTTVNSASTASTSASKSNSMPGEFAPRMSANASAGSTCLKSNDANRTGQVCGDVLSKWEASCPFNVFLTRIPSERNVPYSISFRELFDASLGEVKKICHFNFMVEADWFLEETHGAFLDGKETTVVYGIDSSELEEAARAFPWLKVHLVKSPFPFGHHHTKMTLIEYLDGSMRFLVYTANLIESDWENRTQGLWMSPKCPKLGTKEVKSGIGSNFKADLIEYLVSYPAKCLLSQWINAIRQIDSAQIKVVFVGSAPVTSQSSHNGFQWGSKKMETTLRRFQPPQELDPSWPLIIQCSSIGSLGQSDDWLRTEFGRELLGRNTWAPSTPIRVIYPSDQNVRRCVDGISGGSCLPYSRGTHAKQLWLRKLLHVWKSESTGRSRMMPHIKTYARISPDGTKLGWFLLTSANLSKAAWGKLNKNHDRVTVMSWEAGVLFLPQLFDSSYAFPVSTSGNRKDSEFQLPYDLPLTKYEASDEPWQIETLRDAQL